MKQILISALMIIIACHTAAMQEPLPPAVRQEVILTDPLKKSGNIFKINAFMDYQKIGSVRYLSLNRAKGIWHITRLNVAEKHRRSPNKVGFTLFNACIQDMCQKYATRIEWTAVPIKDSKLTLAQLESIYEKMVFKLQLPPHTFEKKFFRYSTEMILCFQKLEKQ